MNRNALRIVFVAAFVAGASGAGPGEGEEPAGRAIPGDVVRRAFGAEPGIVPTPSGARAALLGRS